MIDVTLHRDLLVQELGAAESVAPAKPPLPIAACVLLEAEDGRLAVSATDLELAVRTACEATVSAFGAVAVPATRMLELARSLPDGPVRLRQDDKGLVITAAGYKGRLQSWPVGDFPPLPEAPEVAVLLPAPQLRDLLLRVRCAVHPEKDERYFLQGAQLEATVDAVRLVATDGHRICVAGYARGGAAQDAVLVPTKALDALYRLTEGVEGPLAFGQTAQHLFFGFGERVLVSRRVDGQFPQYDRIIPKAYKGRAMVPRAGLADAIKRALLLSEQDSRRVGLGLAADALTVSARKADLGEGEEPLAVQYGGPDLALTLNGSYLQDFLRVAGSEDVELSVNDERSSIRLSPKGGDAEHVYVCMPQVA